MSDTEMAEVESIVMSETPHGAINASSRTSHGSYENNTDSGYLIMTPRSGGFTPSLGGCRSRGFYASNKRPYRLRTDARQSERPPRLRSKLSSLINNASDQAFDSTIDDSQNNCSSACISQDSGNFSCERSVTASQNDRSFDYPCIQQQTDGRDFAAELRERRSRTRRAWRSGAAPITPASRLQLLSPPPSPAVPSASFVASEPIDEDVEMKLFVVTQSTPYIDDSPICKIRRAPNNRTNFSPVRSKLVATSLDSVDNGRLGKLVITDSLRPIAEIKPKRLDFSHRALSYALHRTRATPDFTGKANVDIMTLLGEKSNHWRAVSKILGHLAPPDLCSFSMVSNAWRRICINDSRANMRRLSHVILRQNTKENLKLVRKAKLEGNIAMTSPRSRYVRKGYLLEVQNFLQPPGIPIPPNSPPVSPSKVKFHSFVKASRTLEPWEHLLPCPNCSFPCHVDDERNVGKCSRQGCSMEFCTSCSSRPHAGPCKTPLLATPTKRNKRLIVGSRQSKRNLRRL